MYSDNKIWIGLSGDEKICILPQMANRHGLIAGATGTGKTITLKVLAESFSDAGVPVFLADVKGDLSGMCRPGRDSEDMRERIARFGLADCGFQYQAYPSVFWDVYAEMGIPVRTTISEMGPLLLGKLLGLNTTQSDILTVVFKIADDENLLLIDTKDLKSMLQYVAENNAQYSAQYGNIAKASINAILRGVVALEAKGADRFFGEPALNIGDWFLTEGGKGMMNILDCRQLMNDASLYTTFLLWMLSELFEQLPEVGDLDKPRMIFFFDEAHLLFDGAPKALVQKIVQVVKLIRSKGVGVYFISQSPSDIPNDVLAQLSNRVQHALRAYTPDEQKAVRAAARSFRKNPGFDTEEVLMALGVGEALVSFLDEEGVPSVAERAFILPPQSLMGPAEERAVQSLIVSDEFDLKYRENVDRESAYEILVRANEELELRRRQEAEAAAAEKQRQKEEAQAERQRLKEEAAAEKQRQREAAAAEKQRLKEEAAAQREAEKEAERRKKTFQRAASNAASSVARSVSSNIVNSIIGGKTVSTGTMAKRAATNALSSVMREGSQSIIRGLFGNRK